MGDSDISGDIAGGSSRHVPVMLNEVLAVLDGTPASSTRLRLVDGTFGAGGYSKLSLSVDTWFWRSIVILMPSATGRNLFAKTKTV